MFCKGLILLAIGFIAEASAHYIEDSQNGYTLILPENDLQQPLALSLEEAQKWCSTNAFGSQLASINDKVTHDSIVFFLENAIRKGRLTRNNNQLIRLNGRYHPSNTWSWINGHEAKGFYVSNFVQNPVIYLNGIIWASYFRIFALKSTASRFYICEFPDNRRGCQLYLNKRCYVKKENYSRTWYGARNDCLTEGGDLASFETLSDHTLKNSLKNLSLYFTRTSEYEYWVGIQNGAWIWEDSNSSIQLTNCAYYGPYNSTDQCLCLNRRCQWKWKECSCSEPHPFICGGQLKDKSCRSEYDAERSISWTVTFVNETNYQLCSENKTGFCSRTCSANKKGFPIWLEPNCNSCMSKEFQEMLEQIGRLKNVSLQNASEVAKIAVSLSRLTNNTLGLAAGDLNASVSAIMRLTTLREDHNNSLNRDEIKSIVQTISNLLQPVNTKAWRALQKVNGTVATALMSSGDVYGSRLVSSTNETDNTPIKEISENMVLEARIVRKGNLSSDIRFPFLETEQSGEDSISLPSAALDLGWNMSTSVKIWGTYYQNLEEYLPGTNDAILNSRVVSLSIDGMRKGQNLKQPITITFNQKMGSVMKHTRHCVFWEFDSVGSGNWSETGCKVKTSDSEHTVCICDHLTNFAILMSRHPSHSVALSIISMVGCVISVVALILTLIIYSVTWKQAKSDQAVVLMNLCVALIIANVIFLAGADKVTPEVGCTVVAILLHYFFLAAFFIMLAEGVELLLYVIFVFHVRPKSETKKMIVAAWILPLLIVVISLGITRATGYGTEKSCWLAVETGVIWAFIAPVLCIIGVNLMILAIALRKILFAKMPSNQKQKYKKIRGTLWNMSVIFPVLGITWLFGILSVSFSSVVFQYIFAIANSFQGLLIFIFHALFRNQEINKNLSSLFSEIVSHGLSAKSDSTQQTAAQETSEEKQINPQQATVPEVVN